MNNVEIIILAPIFIIILLVTYKTIKSAFNFETAGTFAMSVCVSLLSVIGISRCLKGSMNIILLPYAALGISILVMFYFLGYLKRLNERAKIRNKKKFTYEISTKKQKLKLRQLRIR